MKQGRPPLEPAHRKVTSSGPEDWKRRTSRGRAVVNGVPRTVTASTPAGLWVESAERGHVLLDAGTGSDALYVGVTRG